ncbi:MAG: thymidine phosphorylase [Actinobacteria bacterium]|nr:thymidine phosphorylase [Actinomycetota bacterium]
MTDHRDVVAAKRDGRELSEGELHAFVLAYGRGEVPDYLASAFLMAAYVNGLSDAETLVLTRAMVDSGSTLSLRGIDRPRVDKHSTGGVADGVTLAFAPLAASLGLAVAKLSGRGLGHTGGTLDKLESIPGFRTDLPLERIERQASEVGCVVAAQTADLVPADGALYSLRDATATVGSVPLIAASVMSKKLAISSDLVLLDVKAGSGAFMKTPQEATALADACVRLAEAWGRRCRAAVTDMSQPLGQAVGNALDVAEAVAVLRGEREGRLTDLVVRFAAEAVDAFGGPGDGAARAAAALEDGSALETFGRMVEAQGGDRRVVDDPWSVLPRAHVTLPIAPPTAGWLARVDAEAIGRAATALGAGREKKGDLIDPSVGIEFLPKVGDRLEGDDDLAVIHARDEDDVDTARGWIYDAISLSDDPVEPLPLIYGWRPPEETG